MRFPQAAADNLGSRLRVRLGSQDVVLRRSAHDPTIYSAAIDFDFQAFAREQQRRADLANRGEMIPVFEGREFVRMDKIQFVDPTEIRQAVQLHQSLQFVPQVLQGLPLTMDPSRELMITDLSVVEDPARTFDPCTGQGTPMGAWTFGKLMTDIRNGNQDQASQMVEDWLDTWLTDQTINSFTVKNRGLRMQNLLLNSGRWKRNSSGKLDLSQAPMRLLAIVNRIDLGLNNSNPGEARFVFGVLDPTCPVGHDHVLFTVILEYGVPLSGCTATHLWALQWHHLASIPLGDPAFNPALQQITGQFAKANANPANPNGSALNQLRTNETALASGQKMPWEMREFHLNPNNSELMETVVKQTPDGSFNNTSTVTAYINQFQDSIINDTDDVPLDFPPGSPFLGGSANQVPTTIFWNGNPPPNSNTARRHFSTHTCNGCHGRETTTPFLQVHDRAAHSAASLSAFLIGSAPGTLPSPGTETVADPVDGSPNQFGDLLRREQYVGSLLGNSCGAGGLLQGLAPQTSGFVH